jgi:hypothetical protein
MIFRFLILTEVSMIRVNLSVVLIAIVLCSVACTAGDPSSETWIHGKWELSYDPDGSPKDYLSFSADGAVVSSSPGNDDVLGTYSVEGDRVEIVFKLGSRSVTYEMEISEDRSKLLVYSERTGNTAEYSKIR